MSKIDFRSHYPLRVHSLPTSWATTTVGNVGVALQPGFASGQHNSSGVGIPHIRPMNIGREGTVDLSEVKYVSGDNPLRLRSGDVLFNNTNSPALVGKTAAIRHAGDWAFSNHMTRVRVLMDLEPRFVAFELHYLWMTGYFRHLCINHVNQASVPTKMLAAVPLVVAPTAEQRRIVDKIEELFSDLDAGVSALRRAKANLKRYRAAVLKAAVEGRLTEQWRAQNPAIEPASELLARILKERRRKWEEEQLAKYAKAGKKPPKDWRVKYREPTRPDTHVLPLLPDLPRNWSWATVDQVSRAVRYGSSSKATSKSEGVPILRMGNIQDGRLDLVDLKYLPQNHPEFPELLLEPGDLLFNRTNSAELVGKSAVYRGSPAPCSYASYLISLRLLPGCEPRYVCYFINSTHGRAWVASVLTQQVGQANVNGTKLKRMVFPLPPSAEQEQIVQEVERRLSVIDENERQIDADLKRAFGLRQSVLKRAFEGKLVPQDSGDEPAEKLLERIRRDREPVSARMKRAKTARIPRKQLPLFVKERA